MNINLKKIGFTAILFFHFFVLPVQAASTTKNYTVPFTQIKLTQKQIIYATGITSYLAITALLYSYESILYSRAYQRQKQALLRHHQEIKEKQQKVQVELKQHIEFKRSQARAQEDKKRASAQTDQKQQAEREEKEIKNAAAQESHVACVEPRDLNNLPRDVLRLVTSYAETIPTERLTLAGAFLSCTKHEFEASLKRINRLVLTGYPRENNLYGDIPDDKNLIIAVIHGLDSPVEHFNIRTHIGNLWREAGLIPRTILNENLTEEVRQLLMQPYEQEKNQLLTAPESDDPANRARRTLTDAELTAKRQRLIEIAQQFSTSNDQYESHIIRLVQRVPNPGKCFIAIKAKGEKILILHENDRKILEALTAEQIDLIHALHTIDYSAQRTVLRLSRRQFATFKTLPLSIQMNVERFLNTEIRMRSLPLLFTKKCTQIVFSLILLRTAVIFGKFFCLELASLMAKGTTPGAAAVKVPEAAKLADTPKR